MKDKLFLNDTPNEKNITQRKPGVPGDKVQRCHRLTVSCSQLCASGLARQKKNRKGEKTKQ